MSYVPVLAASIKAAAALVKRRFATTSGGVPAAGANCAGVVRQDAQINDMATVDILGIVLVEFGAAVAAGAAIESDATGRAITRATGATVARMAPGQAAITAAGQFGQVVLIPN